MIRYIQPRFFTSLHRSSQLKPSSLLLSKLDLYRNAHERLIASRILVSPICQPYIYTRSFHLSRYNLKNVSSCFTNFVWILYFFIIAGWSKNWNVSKIQTNGQRLLACPNTSTCCDFNWMVWRILFHVLFGKHIKLANLLDQIKLFTIAGYWCWSNYEIFLALSRVYR